MEKMHWICSQMIWERRTILFWKRDFSGTSPWVWDFGCETMLGFHLPAKWLMQESFGGYTSRGDNFPPNKTFAMLLSTAISGFRKNNSSFYVLFFLQKELTTMLGSTSFMVFLEVFEVNMIRTNQNFQLPSFALLFSLCEKFSLKMVVLSTWWKDNS